MKDSLVNSTYEIELEPGEKLTLPESLIAQVDAGRWLITVHPLSLIHISEPTRPY